MLITIKNIIGSIRNVLGIVTDGLKMWLPFESSGSDTSGNSNNATLYTGKALSFNGVNDYVDCGNIGISLKTLAFWINLDSTTQKVLQVTSSQSVEVSSGTITLNGTWTGSTIYVDATATSTIAASSYKRVVITTTSAITVDDLELGRIGSSYGDFILSDLEIYDTAWTQADVTYDYNKPNHLVTDNASTSIALSNLKGYWALSEGDGAIAYDSSGEKNYGTINGATWIPRQATIPQLGLMDWSKGSNMITYSEDFSEWISSSNVTITDNVVISPEGSQNAGLINFTSGGNYFQNNGSPIVPGNTYTISCYVKRALSTNQVFTLYGNNNKTSGSLTATSEWQRLTYTFTADSTNFASGISTSAACQIYLYGFQVEAGSSPSAYRKTNGTGVTDVTLIANPNNPSQDILGNSVRLREHSLNLDAIGYAEVADDNSLDFGTGDFSLEVWVKADYLNQGNAYNTILSLGDYVITPDNAAIVSLSDRFRFLCGGNSSAKWIDAIGYTQNAWTHLVAVRDSGTTKFYMNTTSQSGGESNNSNITNNDAVLIGKDLTTNRFYSNLIDDVRIYDRALSADEILNNYNVGLPEHKLGSSFSDDFSGDYGN